MTKPGRKRRPRGDAKGGSIADKDDQAVTRQREARSDLLARMKAKTAGEGSQRGSERA